MHWSFDVYNSQVQEREHDKSSYMGLFHKMDNVQGLGVHAWIPPGNVGVKVMGVPTSSIWKCSDIGLDRKDASHNI